MWSGCADADEALPLETFTPRSHVPSIPGDLQRVTGPKVVNGSEVSQVRGPSLKSLQEGDKRAAKARLAAVEAAEAAAEHKAAFTPERLHSDLKAKERLLAKQAKQIAALTKRLEALEGGKE